MEVQIKESELSKLLRVTLKTLRVFCVCFLLFCAVLIAAVDWSVIRIVFACLVAGVALGILRRIRIVRIEAVIENAIAFSSGRIRFELNKFDISFVAKLVRFSISDRFALMLMKKGQQMWNFELFFFINEPGYDLLGVFSRMGIQLRNLPS